MIALWLRLRIEFWWFLEKGAWTAWQRLSAGRASYWLDWLPPLPYVRRKAAERALYTHRTGCDL